MVLIYLIKRKPISIDLFFFRPPAIQSHFNLLSYFHAWYEEFAPIRNKGAYALFNNEHVLNRDQI
jgi:hypothetical protein